MGRDRNDRGRYADGIDPETVLDVFDAREDAARPVTASDVVDELGIARRTAHNKLNALVERGTLATRKIGARGRVWWIPDRSDADTLDAEELRGDPSTTLADESDARADAVDTATDGPADSPADAHGADAADEGDALDAVLAELPSTVDRDAAREAILAAREYLKNHGTATKVDFVRGVIRDHPLGYNPDAALAKIEAGERYRGAWWRKVVKPGLEALDGVTKPPKGASEWRAAEGET